MKIAVHLHLFYFNQLDYFIQKFKNITCDWDLYVTMVEKNEEIENKLKEFKPDTKIILTENLGYDVYPFLVALSKMKFDEYEYVLKLHTKAERKAWSKNKKIYKKYDWRNSLVSSLIGSRKTFENNIKFFQNSNVGMVADKHLILRHDLEAVSNKERTNALVEKYSLNIKNAYFVAGTMFFVRTEIAKEFLNLNLKNEDFMNEGDFHTADSGKLAHSLETLFGDIVNTMGYKIQGTTDCEWERIFCFKQVMRKIFSLYEENGHNVFCLFGIKLKVR